MEGQYEFVMRRLLITRNNATMHKSSELQKLLFSLVLIVATTSLSGNAKALTPGEYANKIGSEDLALCVAMSGMHFESIRGEGGKSFLPGTNDQFMKYFRFILEAIKPLDRDKMNRSVIGYQERVASLSAEQLRRATIDTCMYIQLAGISQSNDETRATGAEAIKLVCHPVHDKIINKSDGRVLEFYASSHPALRVTIQGSKLSAEAFRSENVVVMNGADFVSQREVTHHTGRTSTVFEYKINSRYNGDPSFNSIRIEWWDQHTVNLTRTIVPSTLPFSVEHLYGCSEL